MDYTNIPKSLKFGIIYTICGKKLLGMAGLMWIRGTSGCRTAAPPQILTLTRPLLHDKMLHLLC